MNGPQTGTELVDGRDHAVLPPAMAPGRLSDRRPTEGRVFVIDDDISVRESLELLISTAGWQPGIFASAEEFLAQARGTVPACVILDLTLPGLSGLDLQKQLAGRQDLPIIVVTGHTDVPMTVQAMKAGAVEFLTKPVDDVALLEAIAAAIERSRAALHHDSEMRMLDDRYATLTPREREVMTLVVAGLLNKQVGFELGISETTVKAHRGQVMNKMKADSLPDLVTMATRIGPRPAPTHRPDTNVSPIPSSNRSDLGHVVQSLLFRRSHEHH